MENISSNKCEGKGKIVQLRKNVEQHNGYVYEVEEIKEYNSILIGNNSNIENHSNKPKSYSREGDNTMDDNKILEKFLDKADQDRRDMEQRLTEDRRESEKRIEEQRRLSEERMEKKYMQVLDTVQTTVQTINGKINKLETEVNKLGTEVRENNKSMRNTSIATIIGISAMAVSVIAIVISVILK